MTRAVSIPPLAIAAFLICHAAAPAAAGNAYTQTSASYSLTAFASGEYNETQTSNALGTVSMTLRDSVANEYEADGRLIAFLNDSIELIAVAESRTNTDSTVACSTTASASIGFSVPTATHAVLTATGSGGAGWSAVGVDGGTAGYTATLTGPGGLVFSRSAPDMSENFILEATIPPGDYTYSVSSSTSSVADGDPQTTSTGNCAGGVRLDLSPAAAGCNPADIAEPIGTLDLSDITGFIDAFANAQPQADLDQNGLFDLNDVTAFIAAFSAGCP